MKKCILFGVGTFFENNPSLYPDNYEVIGYGYSDPLLATSHSKNLKNNKPIYSPEEIANMQKKEDIYLFICSGPWSSYEIFLKLREYGVSVRLILFIDETKAMDVSWQSRVDETGNLVTNINGSDFIAILSEEYGGGETFITKLNRYRTSFYDCLKYCTLTNNNNSVLSEYYSKNIKQIISKIENKRKLLDPQKLRIALHTYSGIGDDLTMCRFMFALSKEFEGIEIDFYSKRPSNYEKLPYITHCFSNTDFNFIESFKYDLVLDGDAPLTVYQCDYSKVKQLAPKLFNYCHYCNCIEKNFFVISESTKRFLTRDFIEYTIMLSKKFTDGPDLTNIITDLSKIDFEFPIYANEDEVLNKYGLKAKEYILLNRACDGLQPLHTKLWSLQKYNELTKKIKETFDLPLVQIGQNEFYGIIDNTDLNLLGKTSFEELKVLLKNTLILVSGEGGLVHLSHCLKGKSAVLYGPNDMKYLAYDENINIQGKGCSYKCFEIGNRVWREQCILGYTPPKCMDSISVKDVFERLSEFIKKEKAKEIR